MSRIAAIQMTSGADVEVNLATAARLLRQAKDKGADCAVLPENFALLGNTEQAKLQIAEAAGQGPIQTFLSEQASTLGLWIIAGTIPVKTSDPNKVFATCFAYDATGKSVARYDKIHLFDVAVSQGKEVYRESDATQAGNTVVTVPTPFGRLGLAVCYDIRFPELFRAMLADEVEVLILPAAFTQITGKVHWQTLLQARAIENLCYVVASAQWGQHNPKRQTFGSSMIIEPWGSIIDILPDGEGVVCADIDLAHLHAIRGDFPALSHRKL